ncbi:MAG: cupin domain-containing protein [Cyanobacteria bacterium J06600_6]
MSDRQQTDQVVYAHWRSQPVAEIFPGIKAASVWQGDKNKAVVVTIEPGGKWQGVDVHKTSSEEIFVVSGVFQDGDRNYEAGTFIHYPQGSSHVPQSELGCTLFVFYPN